eukprot:m.52982 g.52982  ORF g.52982 m.52982 type:complete len:378 (+) comp7648_c1_seq2:136-1269(+)
MPFKFIPSLRKKIEKGDGTEGNKQSQKAPAAHEDEEEQELKMEQQRSNTKKRGVLGNKFSFRRYTSETKFQPPSKGMDDEETPHVHFNIGMVTNKGDHPKNEDRATIIEDLFDECSPKDDHEYHGTANKKVSMFCVYDGHGGHRASEYAHKNVQKHLSEMLWTSNYHSTIPDALHHSFKQVEDEFCTWAKRKNDTSGSCATVVVVKGNAVYCGNAGDSQALLILSSGGKKYTRQVLNERHGAALDSERSRIKKAGGTFSRDGAVYGVLFPTRGFGDIDVKSARKNVIICTPNGAGIGDTPSITLNTTQTATLVVASDGLWDFVDDRRVQSIVIASKSPQEAAQHLLDEARESGSDDDVTVVVVNIDFPVQSLEAVPE